MTTFSLVCLFVGIISFGVSFFQNQQNNKTFTGSGFSEGFLMRRLIDKVLPSENSSKFVHFSDYVFVLDSTKGIRDVYLLKIISLVCSVFIAFSVITTNVLLAKSSALAVTEKVPISVTADEYKLLIDGVDFKSITPDLQGTIIKSNIGVLESKETMEKLNQIDPDDLYTYLKEIHNKMSSVFGLSDIVIFIALLVVGWNLPSWLVNALTGLVMSRELFEYDNLETDVLMLCDQQVFLILETLEKNSMFYREFFFRFRQQYTENPDKAYALVATRHEFPEHFKKLVRYLNMIEQDGYDYVKLIIESNKETTKDDIYRELVRVDRKRVSVLNILISVAFFLGLGRVFMTLLTAGF